MINPKFNPEELKQIGIASDFMTRGHQFPYFDAPISLKENLHEAVFNRKPMYQLMGIEQQMTTPMHIPDNVARGGVIEARRMDPSNYGGPDMFGTIWEFVPTVGGSMVRPGAPRLDDMNDWKDEVQLPDIDSWAWDEWFEANKEWGDPNRAQQPCFLSGWYERMISFMDFEGAVLSLIDEDQMDAVKSFLDMVTDVYIKILDKLLQYRKFTCLVAHDDWGGQTGPFFSLDTVREMLVPAMRRFTDYAHSKGIVCEIHSCGKCERLVPAYIEAGWDMWHPQLINDSDTIFEQYGDKIIVGVHNFHVPAMDASEEEQKAAAKAFVEKYCRKDKICTMTYGLKIPPIMAQEIYRLSRIFFED